MVIAEISIVCRKCYGILQVVLVPRHEWKKAAVRIAAERFAIEVTRGTSSCDWFYGLAGLWSEGVFDRLVRFLNSLGLQPYSSLNSLLKYELLA